MITNSRAITGSSHKLKVHGIAIRPGISKNGVLYSEEELQKFAPTLAGKPILKDHNGTTDNTVGVVEHTASKSDGIVFYEGWITSSTKNGISF